MLILVALGADCALLEWPHPVLGDRLYRFSGLCGMGASLSWYSPYILLSSMSVPGKLLWALIVLLLPMVGMLLYCAVGQKV